MSRLACLVGVSDEQFMALKTKFGNIVVEAPEICIHLIDQIDIRPTDEPDMGRSRSSSAT